MARRAASTVGKRLVRAPKVHVRDSGVAHALLGLANLDALVAPVTGVYPMRDGIEVMSPLAAARLLAEQ